MVAFVHATCTLRVRSKIHRLALDIASHCYRNCYSAKFPENPYSKKTRSVYEMERPVYGAFGRSRAGTGLRSRNCATRTRKCAPSLNSDRGNGTESRTCPPRAKESKANLWILLRTQHAHKASRHFARAVHEAAPRPVPPAAQGHAQPWERLRTRIP